ncbi:G-protein coupled receptor Mth isoform X1 [Drosophila bipectinata]|uniref:G-protein coupled receptor Mth isoform X1 n=1 Tax=Drosophila bipectinata TaxID=42026 RepID=UPI0038B33F67
MESTTIKKYVRLIIFGIVLLLPIKNSKEDILDCDYYDTVDLSSSPKFPNDSYLYEGVLIPPHLTGEYEYKLLPDNSRESVAKHWRGCVCKLRPCIRLCCHPHHMLINGDCDDSLKEQLERQDLYINVTLEDGSVSSRHFRKDLVVQWDLPMPCEYLYPVDNQNEQDQYTIFEDGSFLRHFDNKTLDKREYCLQPLKIESEESFRIFPHNCVIESEPDIAKTIMLSLSLLGIVLTISVYAYVEKLKNFQGKCFISYMICLFLGYLCLLVDLWKLADKFCETLGYIGYFFVMAAFFWLSVISLHLWNLFTGRNLKSLPENRFLVFNIYAWGMAGVLTGVIFTVDHVMDSNDPQNEKWMPGVGFYNCWINTEGWSAMIYFYGPLALLISFNITMFILTAIRILQIKRNLTNFTARSERRQKLTSDKQTYSIFLRLFIIMGMTWSLEIGSYLAQGHEYWENVFLVADYLNWSQGIIIFILFVLKPSTFRLICQRPRSKYILSPTSVKPKSLRVSTHHNNNRKPRADSSLQNSTLM